MKSTVEIRLLNVGAFLTIGDQGVKMRWAVTDNELLILHDKLTEMRVTLEKRIIDQKSKKVVDK